MPRQRPFRSVLNVRNVLKLKEEIDTRNSSKAFSGLINERCFVQSRVILEPAAVLCRCGSAGSILLFFFSAETVSSAAHSESAITSRFTRRIPSLTKFIL
jgi:hypothetical protein